MGRRVLCVSLPALRLERLWAERPGLAGVPVVLYAVKGNHEIVMAASPEAEVEGVVAGLTVTQARARCPALRALEVDDEADARALARAAEALLALSPTVALDPPDALQVELAATAHLFGGEEGATADALRSLADLGHLAWAGVADGPDIAWALARAGALGLVSAGGREPGGAPARERGGGRGGSAGGDGGDATSGERGGAAAGAPVLAGGRGPRPGDGEPPAVCAFTPRALSGPGARAHRVEPGRGGAAIRSLPVALLRAPDALVEQLRLIGVRTVGQLAALPHTSVLRRFGAAGERAWRIADGEDDRALDGYVPDAPVAERADLEVACETLEPVAFVLKGLLDRAHARMAGRGIAALRIDLLLGLDGADDHLEEVLLARPLRATPTLLGILRERLGSVQLEGPIQRIELRVAESASFRGVQLDLLTPREAGAETLDEILARLTGAFGAEAVFAPSLADRWRPEGAWGRAPFDPQAGADGTKRAAPGRGSPAGRGGAGGRGGRGGRSGAAATRTASHRAAPDDEPRPEVRPLALLPVPEPVVWDTRVGRGLLRGGRWEPVSQLLGPERLAGEWWGARFDRDYWVVEVGDGARWWIFRDRETGEWRLHGVFE